MYLDYHAILNRHVYALELELFFSSWSVQDSEVPMITYMYVPQSKASKFKARTSLQIVFTNRGRLVVVTIYKFNSSVLMSLELEHPVQDVRCPYTTRR